MNQEVDRKGEGVNIPVVFASMSEAVGHTSSSPGDVGAAQG